MNGAMRRGFTIVELLIVIVVIGILAAIVIVAYQGVTARANDSSVQADLRNIANKIQIFRTSDPAAQYPDATQVGLEGLVKVSKSAYLVAQAGTFSYCRNDDSFSLLARSTSKTAYVYSSEGGLKTVAFNGNLASQCALGGITSTDSGYASVWLLRGTDNVTPGWQPWI